MGKARAARMTLDCYSHEFEKAKRSSDIRVMIAGTGIGEVISSG